MEKQVSTFKMSSLVVVSIVAAATSVVFIRLCNEHPVIIASYRFILAALLLFPFWYRNYNRGEVKYSRHQVKGICLSGFFLSIHIVLWVYAAKLTTAANASLLVNLHPIVVPFIAYFVVKEVLTKKEIFGTIATLAGVAVICGYDFRFSTEHFRGDILSIIAMVFLAAYVVVGRKYRRNIQLINYIVPVYALAGSLMMCYGLITGAGLFIKTWDGLFWILMLTLFPSILGHSILNWLMRYIRSQIASLININQFIPGAIFGYLVFAEKPSVYFYCGVVLIVMGLAVAILRTGNQFKIKN